MIPMIIQEPSKWHKSVPDLDARTAVFLTFKSDVTFASNVLEDGNPKQSVQLMKGT